MTPVIVDLLLDQDEHQEVRLFAAAGLGKMGDEAAVPAIVEVMHTQPSTPLHVQLVTALGGIGAEVCISPLLTALHDDRWIVRANAAEALGKIDDERVVGPLVACLRDRKQAVRLEAALSLARVGDAHVLGAMEEAESRSRFPSRLLMRDATRRLRQRALR
jgi:HEAT repeat protein